MVRCRNAEVALYEWGRHRYPNIFVLLYNWSNGGLLAFTSCHLAVIDNGRTAKAFGEYAVPAVDVLATLFSRGDGGCLQPRTRLNAEAHTKLATSSIRT